jgi:diguanylate cyclase (GGDEF)-like protein
MLNSFKALFMASNPNALIPAGMQASLAASGIKTAQFRWLVLGPSLLIIIISIGTLITAVYRHEDDEISREVRMMHTTANRVYQDNLEQSTRMLAGIAGTMAQDAELRSALAKQNRADLARLVATDFITLQNEYQITHLDLIGADRTVLLRAQSPAYFGDVTNRATTLDAQRTQAPAHGIELDTEGDLALRLVSPLYQDEAKQHPIGFIELGVDTNQLLKNIQKSLGIQMFEFISKDFLKREVWQQGMADTTKSTALSSEWDRFPDVAPSAQALKDMTPEMSAIMSKGIFPTTESMMEVSQGESEFRAISFPILDIQERKVGSIVMLVDVTSQELYARNTLYLGLILGISGGGLLFAFFWLLTGRVGRLIEWHQEALNHLATRDGLTGLFNQITFYTMLEDEVARSQRSATPVSLLMLDLDHFKGVNDKFGHVTGDTVLKEFGRIIHRQSRSIDKVCRFGGEDIAVILPETNAAGAMLASERMRNAIEGHLFQTEKGHDLSLTISIGMATVPEHGTSGQELVNAADRALNIAKERGRNQVYRYNP